MQSPKPNGIWPKPQSEMVLTEPDWDWNWSHPGPSCGSQLYNCNQAAKRESWRYSLQYWNATSRTEPGLHQTIPKKACFAAGTQVTVFQRKQLNNWLFLLSTTLRRQMPEVSCKACQKETFLCNQTVSVLTCPCSTCPVPPQNRSCSAPGLHERMLVKLSSWLGKPPQIHAGWSMPWCLSC